MIIPSPVTRSEKLRREVELAEALLKQREQDSDRYSGREDDPQVPRQLRQSRHRRPLPAHLPREIHRLEPEESCCPECGGNTGITGVRASCRQAAAKQSVTDVAA
ncbi:hypothetical protein [Escherichia coli]|uniref:hypothetical protein n=1 Tax=Escherichia coli TaxID=562 RepID=UPI003F5CC717